MLPRLVADLRHATRAARDRPALLLLSAATVMLVVGAGSAVFAVASATLVRPLPFVEADRLARIYLLPPGVTDPILGANPLHPLDLVRLRERLTVAQGPEGLWARERAVQMDDGGDPESLRAADVTAGLFDLLGAPPALGRTFTEAEDVAGAPVAVISHGVWHRLFGGDAGAIGRTLTIDRIRHEIIGVMPPDFEPAYSRSEIWTPLNIHAGRIVLPGATFIQNVVRLRPGRTMTDLEAEVRAIVADIAIESPATMKDWRAGVRTIREAQFGPQRTPLLLLVAAVGALALIAAANLMNLTLTRVMSRRPETALRLALGARVRDLLRAEAVESLLVAGLGGLSGLLAAYWLLPAILALDPVARPALGAVTLDARVLAATAALALVVTLAASMIPVVRDASGRRAVALSDVGRRTTGSARSEGARTWLVAAETALALVMLSSALLIYQAFDATSREVPGFDADRVVGAQLRLSETAYPSVESRTALLNRLLEAVRTTPGIVEAATTINVLVPGNAFVTLAFPTETPMPGEVGRTVQFRRISDGYFRTMRIPLEAGRDFDAHDTTGAETVAIVSRRFVDAYLDGQDPIGRRIRRGQPTFPPLRIVGVVGDVRDVGYGQAAQPTIYTPYRQGSTAAVPVTLVVRTVESPLESVGAIRAAIRRVDPAQPLSNVVLLTDYLSDSLGPQRFRSVLLGTFAALGLLLASVGIYGVTARSVVERTREVGVRLALGGSAASVWRDVARRPVTAVVIGGLAGAALSAIAARVLAAYVTGTGAGAAGTVGLAAVVLLASGMTAALVPAWRATRVDPLTALRSN